MDVVCKAGGEIKMDEAYMDMLVELIISVLLVFLIVSNVLGDRIWIAWLVAAFFVVYKIAKGGWNNLI